MNDPNALASQPVPLPRLSGFTTRRALIIILVVSMAARVAVALIMGNAVDTLPGIFDQVSYHTLAVRVLTGHGFTFDREWWPITPAGQPTAHWSYLYTLWLVAVYAVAGVQPVAARVLQALLVGALLPWLVFRLARRVFPAPPGAVEVTALLAAAWSAVYGYLAYYAGALMTESFYIVGLLWVLDCTLRLAPGAPPPTAPAWWRWAELGIALGVTALLRQVFLPCVPVLLGWLYWQWLRAGGRRVTGGLVLGTALAGAVCLALIAPVTAFNYRQFQRFVLLNTNAGYAFFWANHPIYGDQFVAVLTSANYTDLIPPELRHLDEAALDNALLQRGLEFVQADPARYLRLSISRIPIYFMFWPTADAGWLSNTVRLLSFGLALPFMLLGLGVWAVTSRGRRAPGLLLVLFLAAYSLIHLLSWSLIRYRLPVDAIALVFAGRGAAALLGQWGRARGLSSHLPLSPETP